MNYLPTMSEEEIKYVCSVIPLQESVGYFNRYPRDFAKIMPGFRAKSLKAQKQVSSVLYKSRNQPFVSSFIEKHISRWLDEIQREIALITDKGESKESAWMQTLPFCFFVDNIRLFFKLIEEKQSDEFISLLSVSVKQIRDLDNSSKKLEASLNESKSEQTRLNDEIKRVQTDLEKLRKKLIERHTENKKLITANESLRELESVVFSCEQEIEHLRKKLQDRDELIQQQKNELSTLTIVQQQLHAQIREEYESQRVPKYIEKKVFLKPRCPKDIEEFKDYLGYNLESLDMPTDAEYYALLKDYLCEILFQGKPIIINRKTGIVLMKCIANALIGSTNVATLSFSADISERQIDDFLSTKNRIICLDNFIGNFNETTLLTICHHHKDKIIFLTMFYDRTLCYVPQEFLGYCYYLNLNRIKAFNCDHQLTEDPSFLDEVEASNLTIIPDTRWSRLLKEILDELEVCSALSTYTISFVSDEESLCRILAFDVLPFCVDVLKIPPYSASERLNKYAGDMGRCLYKELFRGWFA